MDLQNELTDRLLTNSLEKRLDTHQLITDVVFTLIKNHNPENRQSYSKHDAFILFQMCMLRSISILELSKGFKYHNPYENSRLESVDVLSVASLTRCILESYCNFNNIYIQSKTEKEQDLKYTLWVIAGLKNRQSHNPIQEQFKLKKENEAVQIANLIKSIHSNEVALALNDRAKSNIQNAIKDKKWQLQIEGNNASIIGWQKLLLNAGANDVFDHLYTILSWNTHPSNISVSQFAEAYETNTETEILRTTLEIATSILSFFIHDYCIFFPELRGVLLNTPIVSQELIKIHNRTFRKFEL